MLFDPLHKLETRHLQSVYTRYQMREEVGRFRAELRRALLHRFTQGGGQFRRRAIVGNRPAIFFEAGAHFGKVKILFARQ